MQRCSGLLPKEGAHCTPTAAELCEESWNRVDYLSDDSAEALIRAASIARRVTASATHSSLLRHNARAWGVQLSGDPFRRAQL